MFYSQRSRAVSEPARRLALPRRLHPSPRTCRWVRWWRHPLTGGLAGEQLADDGLSPMVGQDSRGRRQVKSVSKLDNHLLSERYAAERQNSLRQRWPATRPEQTGRFFTGLLAQLQHIQFNVVNADTLEAPAAATTDCWSGGTGQWATAPSLLASCRRIQDDIIPPHRASAVRSSTRAPTSAYFNPSATRSMTDKGSARWSFKGCPSYLSVVRQSQSISPVDSDPAPGANACYPLPAGRCQSSIRSVGTDWLR